MLAVLSSPEEVIESTDSETFTQLFPLSQRAFFYYPTGAGGYFNRPTIPAASSVDFINNPYDTAASPTAQDMIRPAAYFVPAADLLSMPYPSKIDQEEEEKAAMKHLEMLKELHDQLENNEQRFMGNMMPSFSLGGNAVTMPTNSLLALLRKFTKTVTKTVLSTVSTCASTPSSTTTDVISTTNSTLLMVTVEDTSETTTDMTISTPLTTTSTPSIVITTITSTVI